VPDVEDEVPGSIRPIANKCAAGWAIRVDMHCRHVNTVPAEACQIDPAKIVITDSRDNAHRLPKLCSLVGEDGRCARWERTGQRLWGIESLANCVCHDLDQNFPNDDDFFHGLAPEPSWYR